MRSGLIESMYVYVGCIVYKSCCGVNNYRDVIEKEIEIIDAS